MGQASSELSEQEAGRVRAALEEIENLVWDEHRHLNYVCFSEVEEILVRNSLARGESLGSLKKTLKDREAEQAGKHKFFKGKSVEDLARFHLAKEQRYNSAHYQVDRFDKYRGV